MQAIPWESALTGLIQAVAGSAAKIGFLEFNHVGNGEAALLQSVLCGPTASQDSNCNQFSAWVSAAAGIAAMLLIEGAAHVFMYKGMQRSGATTFVGVSLATQVLGAGCTGQLLLNEPLSLRWFIGACMLLAGVALLVSSEGAPEAVGSPSATPPGSPLRRSPSSTSELNEFGQNMDEGIRQSHKNSGGGRRSTSRARQRKPGVL